mgnify:CR=1 FL=1
MSLFFRVPPHIVDRRRRRRIPVRPKTAKITMAFPGQKTLAEALHANGTVRLLLFLVVFCVQSAVAADAVAARNNDAENPVRKSLVAQKTTEKSAAETRSEEDPPAPEKQGNSVNELGHGTLFLFGFIFGFYTLCALVGLSRMARD